MNSDRTFSKSRHAVLLGALLLAVGIANSAPDAPIVAKAQQLINQGSRSVMQSSLQEINAKLISACQTPTSYCNDLKQAASVLQSELSK